LKSTNFQNNAKQVSKVTSAKGGILITAICCIGASGNSIPPTYIWPTETDRNTTAYMRGTPAGSLGLHHYSGWMTEENFAKWMNHFIKHVKPSTTDPVLLLLDNHRSHLYVSAINIAKEAGVIMLTFPPHTTNKLQPLNVSAYGPLRIFYGSECDSWQLSNPGKTISLYDIGELSGKAIVKALTPENILAGYRKTGIFPFDANIFQESDFLPAYVTDPPDTSIVHGGEENIQLNNCEPSTSSFSSDIKP